MVTYNLLGVIFIQPHDEIYQKHNIISMNCIIYVGPTELKIFIEKYSSGSYRLDKTQKVAQLLPQPGSVRPTNINFFEVTRNPQRGKKIIQMRPTTIKMFLSTTNKYHQDPQASVP